MLPSTGYFKGINCPFYESGLCERPYCHFRHVKKESISSSNEGTESGAILQKLVSAAVQKVLQQSDSSGSPALQLSVSENTVNTVSTSTTQPSLKATYNPTPISELNKINNTHAENSQDVNEQRKRHIPVPYTPRKPNSVPIKRPLEDDGHSKPFIYIPPPVKYTPGSSDGIQLDPYTPKGSSETNGKYLPGSEVELQEYTPNETHLLSKLNYIPSGKNVNTKKKILEYKPAKVSFKSDNKIVTYQPTPRALAPCFSSDEEEPYSKKRKLSSDLNGFDDLGPEFDILDQILDEEKLIIDTKISEKKDECLSRKNITKAHKNNDKKERKVEKSEDKKSHHRHKTDKKDKNPSQNKDNMKTKDKKSSDKKSSHKSSHKEKSHKDDKHNHSLEKKTSNSFRSSEKKSKFEDKNKKSSKDDKNSKHDKSSKSSNQESTSSRNKSNHHKSREKDSKDRHEKSKGNNNLHNHLLDNSDHNNPDLAFEQNVEEHYEISESDEETIALECKKIFEEYVPTQKIINIEEKLEVVDDKSEDNYVPVKRRISRTQEKNIKVIPKAPVKPDFKGNAAQAMASRLSKIKEYHVSRNHINPIVDNSNVKTEFTKIASAQNNSKIRIAHVPYASTLMNAKKIMSPNINVVKTCEPSTSSTVVQTIKKGAQRVAHMPNEKFIDRPGVLEPLASKIPANIRSTYLNMMIDECLKIYLSATDAYARAQNEELTTSKKCNTVPIYKNSAVLTISRLRKELQECNGVKKTSLDCTTSQKNPLKVSGITGNTGTWSIESKHRRFSDNPKEFSGSNFYNNIKHWVLNEEQLKENGFPRPHPKGDKGRAIIYGQSKHKPPVGYIRTCCRCKKDYIVDKKGFAAVKEECIYHPNNKYRVRGEVKYQCCSQDGTSDGCCIAPSHVYEYVDFENLKGYVRTLPPDTEMDDYGVYSLDCEMCYTTHGLDLTRVTVINSACKVVFETLIRPFYPIIDYNTRYSGITEAQMADVKTSLLDVQATLLTMFNNRTILIGHSLESDFKALKLIHDTVIDTSVLFPHKMGPPYKRALRNLTSEHLKKIIQNSIDGHDSAEDATVCMELVHFKLKELLKTR